MANGASRNLQIAPVLGRVVLAHLGDCWGRLAAPVEPEPPAALRELVSRLTAALSVREAASAKGFHDGLRTALPNLKAYAISLSRSHHRADDLVQTTMVKALRYADRFEQGTNLEGWLFRILRNEFYTEHRRRHREVEDPDGVFAGKLGVMPEQEARAGHADLLAALGKVPAEQREALLLVGAEGVSYEAAAELCKVPIGTIKSRVNRARMRLAALLAIEGEGDLGADGFDKAALAGAYGAGAGRVSSGRA